MDLVGFCFAPLPSPLPASAAVAAAAAAVAAAAVCVEIYTAARYVHYGRPLLWEVGARIPSFFLFFWCFFSPFFLS